MSEAQRQGENTQSQPDTSQAASNTTSTESTQPGGDTQATVPSGRLREEADKRRNAEQELNKLKQLNARILQAYQQQRPQGQQQRNEAQARAASGDDSSDLDQTFMDQVFGTDDTGKNVQKAIDVAVRKAVKANQPTNQGQGVTPQQVQQYVQQAVQGVQGQMTGSAQMVTRLNNLLQRGVMSQQEAKEVQQEVAEKLQNSQMASAAKNPAQLDYLVSDVIARKLESDQPLSSVRPVMPVQPGGNGEAGSAEEMFDPASSPFSSLQSLDAEGSERLTRLSQQRNQGGR